MPIQFTCPHCGRLTNVADEYAGQSGPCSGCGRMVTIPQSGVVLHGAPRGEKSSGGMFVLLIAGAVLVAVLLCAGAGLVAFRMTGVATQGARGLAMQAQCTNNLKQIAVAFHQHHDDKQTLPPAFQADAGGLPQHSWRTLILPYLDPVTAQRYNLNEPWNGPSNLPLASTQMSVYHCSATPMNRIGETSYLMIVGPNAVSDGPTARTVADIKDGLSNTMIVGEVAGSGILWPEPRDFDSRNLGVPINTPGGRALGSGHPGLANVVFGDGSVRAYSDATSPQQLQATATINGGEAVAP